ncbi:hypothetical protein ACFLVS_00420 [Chloroflexota bacterium]
MVERIGREDLVCNWENEDWKWWFTYTETYIRSILKRISQKALGNVIGDCELNYKLYSYIGSHEDGQTDWFDSIPENEDPNAYTEVWELFLNDESVGASDNILGAQEVFKLVIDHYLNIEETASLIALFKQLRTLEIDIHTFLEEALQKRKYYSYDCRLCQRQSA